MASVLARVRELRLDTSDWRVASVIVREGEDGAAAFERVKTRASCTRSDGAYPRSW